jgi:hypothetical protein
LTNSGPTNYCSNLYNIWVYSNTPVITLANSKATAGNTKGGNITVPLASCLTGLELAV